MSSVAVDFDPFAGGELARVVPSTEAQREVWLADQLGREASLAYNESVSLQLNGALNYQALQNALLALSNRHDALRSTISADGLSLIVARAGSLPLQSADLAELDEPARCQALAKLRSAAVETPFDLIAGPLIRAVLVRLSTTSHELILTAHHIVCDGWSFGVVATELMALYASVSLPAAEGFADHATALASDAQRALADADSRWWLQVYDQSVPVLELPMDRTRPATRTFASKREDLLLETTLVEAVRKLGAQHGASLFATLFSAFSALMARLAGIAEQGAVGLVGSAGAVGDVVIGVPAAGQAAHGSHTLVGHCVQLLPIRVAVDLNQPFAALLTSASGQVLDAYEHQACTYGSLLTKLQMQRDQSRLPLVSVLFNLDQAIRPQTLSQGGLAVTLRSNPRSFENFELFVNASQSADGITLECQYNCDLFDAATVRRWLVLYQVALRRLVSAVPTSTAQAFAPTADDEALFERFNNGANAVLRADAPTVSALISAQVSRGGSRRALTQGLAALSYDELEAKSNRLARALRERGVGRGQYVGLCVARGLDMVVAQLAILKSGAAYVPLDPSYPSDRLTFMAQDAGLALLLADRSVANVLVWPRAQTLLLDADAAAIATHSGQELPPDEKSAQSHDPAYVIYTSGSTGKPKGVMVPHRAVVNFLCSMRDEPGLVSDDILVAVTTLSFDIAVLELLLPLTVGAQVVLADQAQVADAPALAQLLAQSGATMMQATPGLWRMLLDAGWRGNSRFKALIGGEALPADLAQRLLAQVGQLWNMYGPTETTVWSTCARVTNLDQGISIGRPIANTQVHVLDEHSQRLPVGVVGEIWIAGQGVALGYLGRPELTAERFVGDPFSQQPNATMYRTGDRGRWRADGQLQHLGRLDAQVKVRGYRIELGEIETALASHPALAQVLVLVREDTPGDQRLVAYFVAREQPPGNESRETLRASLRDHLRAFLPSYMMPQHFVALAKMPTLPNGKIDCHALPAPLEKAAAVTAATAAAAQAATQPQTTVEKSIAQQMETVLSLPGIGLDDNFFALGGHSLLAAQLAALLGQVLGTRVPLRTIFAAPSVRALAQWAQGLAEHTQAKPLIIARREPSDSSDPQTAPLSLMQHRIWFLEQLDPGRAIYNLPSAHRLRGAMDEAAFLRAFAQVVQRQESLRTVIDEVDNAPIQVILPALADELMPMVDLTQLPVEQREARLQAQLKTLASHSFDLTQAPLFCARLFRLAADDHVFYFGVHHIVWDGWSFDVLHNEMARLYAASSPLPPLPLSYGDFAAWHSEWMRGDELTQQVAYWKERLAGHLEPLALPSDKLRPAQMSGDGAATPVSLPLNSTQAASELARTSNATLFMVLLTAYALTLHQASGQRQLLVGVPVRGRPVPELDRVTGLFVNMLPLRINIEPAVSFAALLAHVRECVIDAFKYPDVPLEQLVRELKVPRDRSRSPVYQALFSFEDARERPASWGGLVPERLHVRQPGIAEDIGLWTMERVDGLVGGLSYNTDIISQRTAETLRDRFVAIVDWASKQPDRPIEQWLLPALDLPGAAAMRPQPVGDLAPNDRDVAAANPASSHTIAPLTSTEQLLANIWSPLLGTAHIRSNDNFFDLGGHSLLAMQAVLAMEKQTGKRIERSRFIFETLGQIANAYDAAPASAKTGPIRSLLSGLLGKKKSG